MHIKSTDKPIRVQYLKGGRFLFPEGSKNHLRCVYVARPTPWANPYRVEKGSCSREEAVEAFRRYVAARPTMQARIRHELRGKNLACWCALDSKPCHADVLLEVANSAAPKPIDPAIVMKNSVNEALAQYIARAIDKAQLMARIRAAVLTGDDAEAS